MSLVPVSTANTGKLDAQFSAVLNGDSQIFGITGTPEVPAYSYETDRWPRLHMPWLAAVCQRLSVSLDPLEEADLTAANDGLAHLDPRYAFGDEHLFNFTLVRTGSLKITLASLPIVEINNSGNVSVPRRPLEQYKDWEDIEVVEYDLTAGDLIGFVSSRSARQVVSTSSDRASSVTQYIIQEAV